MTRTSYPLGIDVGGTGIKGAPVDLDKGAFASERIRFETPAGASPDAVADVIAQIVEHFADMIGDEPIGVTIPGVVQHGVVRTAANIDKAWIGTNAEELISAHIGRDVLVVNDADAAGIAENFYGAAKDTDGLVLVTTLGTGIGTAVINDGVLVPNSELGHIEVDPAQHVVPAEGLAQALDLDGVHVRPPACRLRRSRATSQSVKRASGIVIATNRTAAAKYEPNVNDALASICDWLNASITPSVPTRAVSFCRPMKSFSSGGITLRTACGKITKRSAWKRDRPSERAAASWLGCTDSIPAR